tara:strand:+ start:390 stop:680 length:291 start_codon:yes stop_codon:yes gene_type:complete
MIPLSKVIAELDPNADVTCSGNNIDNIIWHKGTPIAKDIIEAKQNELQAEYDAEEYKRNRKAAYPLIEDQLDEIYHNGINGWKETIKTVKDKYPKE